MLPLTLSDITVRRRGKTVLGPLDLTLEGPGLTAVIGPNGAGKSTLLRVMHGVERLSGGTCRWTVPEAEARANQSFVFQTPILLRRSVADNLRYPLALRGDPAVDKKMRDASESAGLDTMLDMPAHRLSGGERQKLALARALITGPQVLFLDEPCASLDGPSTRSIENMLTRALTNGTRIVLATHDMGQVHRLATEVIFLHRGQLIAHGTTLLQNPPPLMAAFLNGDILE